MKNRMLSVIIPAFNVERYIERAVCSVKNQSYKNIEIIVVNDGSKDDTVEKINHFIKENYSGSGQPVIRVIDKPNGGHGSTINKGIELATGKYFRLLDGDDYYVTEELDKLMEKLHTEDSDLVLTNYIEDFSVTGEFKRTRLYEELTPGIQYKMEDITTYGYGFSSWGPLLHTATYKTQLLKDANFHIDEHCFYVDMEYNLMGVLMANTHNMKKFA